LAPGDTGLDALDDGIHGAVADRLCVVRDGPRVVIFDAQK
jgi:hypothetical protein